MDDTYAAREHMKALFAKDEYKDANKFLISLGDVGESKDCTETKQLYAGTTACFELVSDYLENFGVPYDVVGGNHDLEGIDEFPTDAANLEAYLKYFKKETPQFCHQVAEKTLLVGLGSTRFRDAEFTSHEVYIDDAQVEWFEQCLKEHSAEDDWRIFVFTHAPIIGSGLRCLQENHVVNGCAWLNHCDRPQRFIDLVRKNSQIKGWFNGHLHLSHDYEDSITFPGGNNRGSCVFVQTGVMRTGSSRDGRRQSRFIRGNEHGFEIYTVNHANNGALRLDATVTYADQCAPGDDRCEIVVFAHDHEDFDHDKWFAAFTPQPDDGCYIEDVSGLINPDGSDMEDMSKPGVVCWWHLKDGAVLGVHGGMMLEYDRSTLAPLGLVVSRDELRGKKVAVIDDGYDGSALILYADGDDRATVVQPNEDGTYWRRIVRNKVHRTREKRRCEAASNWLKERNGPDSQPKVLSSYGPYIGQAGNALGVSTRAHPTTEKELEAMGLL
mmetsp:Transcript_9600/g.13285  ORF Transcript_9600/g.13285 Transcript_9600/m.13285 type:complete len:497 (+) Transcript_9600:189-1679(+)